MCNGKSIGPRKEPSGTPKLTLVGEKDPLAIYKHQIHMMQTTAAHFL